MLPSGSRTVNPMPSGSWSGRFGRADDDEARGLAALPDRLRIGRHHVQRLVAGRAQEDVVLGVGAGLDDAAFGPAHLAVDHGGAVVAHHHQLFLEAEHVDQEPDAGEGVAVGDHGPDPAPGPGPVGDGDGLAAGPGRRRPTSIGRDSIHRWPYGSISTPWRLPWGWSAGSRCAVAPAATARANWPSTSVTVRCRAEDVPPSVVGLRTPSASFSSLSMKRALPMRNSAWPMRPPSMSMRNSSTAPKASAYQSRAHRRRRRR